MGRELELALALQENLRAGKQSPDLGWAAGALGEDAARSGTGRMDRQQVQMAVTPSPEE